MSFNKYPSVQFKLNTEIDMNMIPNHFFVIERKYHSGGELMTDTIHCKVLGSPEPESRQEINKNATGKVTTDASTSIERNTTNQQQYKNWTEEEEQTVRINGITSNSDIPKGK